MTQSNDSLQPVSRAQVDPFGLDALDDAALDELPFGVICLDPEGVILRYNVAEAKMARLDRNQIIGRLFFEEVAPCTRTDEFEGRFRALVSAADEGPRSSGRFGYLFDFKFGAQRVEVEMVRAPQARRYYVLVARQSFTEPRTELPDGWAAPRLRELAGAEDGLGVRRDPLEQRVAEVPAAMLEALLRTCDIVAPSTWEVFCRRWGVEWGRRAVVALETESLQQTGESLHQRPMSEVAERLSRYLRDQGWGDLGFDFSYAKRGAIVFVLRRSLLAEASRRRQTRRCHLLAGVIAAVFSHLAGRLLHAEEVVCRCQGAEACQLILVGIDRKAVVIEGARDQQTVGDIVRRLGGVGRA